MAEYAVYNRTCGHVVNVSFTRPMAQMAVRIANPWQKFALRIRHATTADITAVITGVRCGVCSLDGRTKEAPREVV